MEGIDVSQTEKSIEDHLKELMEVNPSISRKEARHAIQELMGVKIDREEFRVIFYRE